TAWRTSRRPTCGSLRSIGRSSACFIRAARCAPRWYGPRARISWKSRPPCSMRRCQAPRRHPSTSTRGCLDAWGRRPYVRCSLGAPGARQPKKAAIIPRDKRYAMGVSKVSDSDFETEVLKSTEPVVVDFWAEWCGPCRMIAPALEEIAGTMNGKVKIVKLNVDENPATAAKYGIMSIPTLMLFKNGELSSRQVGAAPKQK